MKTYLFIILIFAGHNLKSQNIDVIKNLISSERFDDAYDSLIKFKNQYPQNPFVYFELGETVLKSYINDPYSETKKKAISDAENFFNQGTKQDSLNPINYVGLGIIELFRNEDTIKADTYFNKSISLIPEKKKKINDLHVNTLLKLSTSELYAKSPRFYKAESYINRLIKLKPKLPEVYIAFGDILLAKSDASGAILNYKKALYLRNTPLTNVLIARIYMMARNLNESRVYFEDAIKMDSLFAPAYKGLGDLYYLAGQPRFAKENYIKFLQLTGNNIPAKINYLKALYKSKDYTEASNIAEEITKIDSSKIYLYRIAAYSGYDKENPQPEKALYYIKELFKKAPQDEIIPRDYSYYGRILLKLNRDSSEKQQGIQMFEKAYLTDTSDNFDLNELINAAYYNKDFKTAIRYESVKIGKGEHSTDNYKLLGKAYYYNKDFAHADSIFTIVVAKDTTNLDANIWLAYSLSSEDQDMKMGLAKPCYERILRIIDDDKVKYSKEMFEAYSYLGSYYVFSKNVNYERAIDYFKQITELDKDNTQWCLKGYYSLAYIYTKLKQWSKAKDSYEMVLKYKPGDTAAEKGIKDMNYNLVMEELNK